MIPKPQSGVQYFKSYKALNLQGTFLRDTLYVIYEILPREIDHKKFNDQLKCYKQ